MQIVHGRVLEDLARNIHILFQDGERRLGPDRVPANLEVALNIANA